MWLTTNLWPQWWVWGNLQFMVLRMCQGFGWGNLWQMAWCFMTRWLIPTFSPLGFMSMLGCRGSWKLCKRTEIIFRFLRKRWMHTKAELVCSFSQRAVFGALVTPHARRSFLGYPLKSVSRFAKEHRFKKGLQDYDTTLLFWHFYHPWYPKHKRLYISQTRMDISKRNHLL